MVCRGANRDGYQWLEGIGRWLRVWGRGRRNRKVCILAVGQDTAAEREAGMSIMVKMSSIKNEVMCDCVRWELMSEGHFWSTLNFDEFKKYGNSKLKLIVSSKYGFFTNLNF
jgi:hypothetical protein